jgi:hypothetical protein
MDSPLRPEFPTQNAFRKNVHEQYSQLDKEYNQLFHSMFQRTTFQLIRILAQETQTIRSIHMFYRTAQHKYMSGKTSTHSNQQLQD